MPSLFPHFSLSLLQEILSGNPMDCESGYISKKRPHTIITFLVTFYVMILIPHNLFLWSFLFHIIFFYLLQEVFCSELGEEFAVLLLLKFLLSFCLKIISTQSQSGSATKFSLSNAQIQLETTTCKKAIATERELVYLTFFVLNKNIVCLLF